jgi:hypothetical protein
LQDAEGLSYTLEAWKKTYNDDLLKKDEKAEEKSKKLKIFMQGKSLMPDTHHAFTDAKLMYDFMANKVCKDIQDITIMSDKADYYRLFEKPKYEGDFLKQMFDWNENSSQAKKEIEVVATGIKDLGEKNDSETWDSFEKELNVIKYKAKHDARIEKKKLVKERID